VTNQQVVIHYNCIGAFEVPDRKKIPEADIIMETRKGGGLGPSIRWGTLGWLAGL